MVPSPTVSIRGMLRKLDAMEQEGFVSEAGRVQTPAGAGIKGLPHRRGNVERVVPRASEMRGMRNEAERNPSQADGERRDGSAVTLAAFRSGATIPRRARFLCRLGGRDACRARLVGRLRLLGLAAY